MEKKEKMLNNIKRLQQEIAGWSLEVVESFKNETNPDIQKLALGGLGGNVKLLMALEFIKTAVEMGKCEGVIDRRILSLLQSDKADRETFTTLFLALTDPRVKNHTPGN